MASREWKGFSEEELQLIKKQISEPELNIVGITDNASGKRAKFESRKSKKNVSVDKRLQLLEVKFDDGSIKPEQKLSRSSSESSAVPQSVDKNVEIRGQSTLIKVNSESQRYELIPPPPPPLPTPADRKKPSTPTEALHTCHLNAAQTPCTEMLPEQTPLFEECTTENRQNSKVILEEFEQRQKQLESENAKRKALLLKAIDDSKKRTQEETNKIIKIQAELAKLDFHLSSDVSILRSQIEEASLEYDKAQKRYERAEKEFVEAKLAVFQRMERKERLTEHLCTIIEQNETRKAMKLGELMAQLGLETLFGNCKNAANEITTLLPQLCALNEASLKACQTLKPQANLHNASQSHNNNNTHNEVEMPEDCQTNGVL